MSFAQEMKDFMAGWQTVDDMGQKKKESESMAAYRDATIALQTRQADLSERNADRNYALAASRAARSGKSDDNAKLYNDMLDDFDNYPSDFLDTPQDAGDGGDGTEKPVLARGGLVRKQYAAEGALIGAEPAPPAPAMAIPTTPMGDVAAPADDFAFAPEPAPAPAADPAAEDEIVRTSQEATSAVALELVADAKKPEAAVGPDAEESSNIVKNKGGLSMEEWKGIASTIDPNGTIPSHLKGAAVLGSAYKYFIENGQPEKAAKIAKGILITNKMMTQTLGALAQNAMEQGDAPSAAKLLTDAGNGFPSGQQFSVSVGEGGALTYAISEKGEVVKEGELNTDQFWALAGKVKDGSMYLEEMGRFASMAGGGGTSKEGALTALGGSYVAAMQAKAAFENAETTEVEGEELEALRAAALQAGNDFLKQQEAALKMGIKRTDIKAITSQAEAMAIPAGPAAEGEAAADGGGFLGYLADGLDPSKYGEAAAAMQPGQNPEAVAGATPQGNANLRPASPADLANARAAIANGADPEAVARRFIESGFSPEGL